MYSVKIAETKWPQEITELLPRITPLPKNERESLFIQRKSNAERLGIKLNPYLSINGL